MHGHSIPSILAALAITAGSLIAAAPIQAAASLNPPNGCGLLPGDTYDLAGCSSAFTPHPVPSPTFPEPLPNPCPGWPPVPRPGIYAFRVPSPVWCLLNY